MPQSLTLKFATWLRISNMGIPSELANKKIFSLNDLIQLGLIKQEDVDKWIQYQQAKQLVNELFKGMF